VIERASAHEKRLDACIHRDGEAQERDEVA
jgi:hypothetical protein